MVGRPVARAAISHRSGMYDDRLTSSGAEGPRCVASRSDDEPRPERTAGCAATRGRGGGRHCRSPGGVRRDTAPAPAPPAPAPTDQPPPAQPPPAPALESRPPDEPATGTLGWDLQELLGDTSLSTWTGIGLLALGGYLVLSWFVPGIDLIGSLILLCAGIVLLAQHFMRGAGAWALYLGAVLTGMGAARALGDLLPGSPRGLTAIGIGIAFLAISYLRHSQAGGYGWQGAVGAAALDPGCHPVPARPAARVAERRRPGPAGIAAHRRRRAHRADTSSTGRRRMTAGPATRSGLTDPALRDPALGPRPRGSAAG